MKKLISVFCFLVSLNLWAAKIINFQGDIFFNNEKISDFLTLEQGGVLRASGKKSFVIVKFKDGSKSILKDGEITIQESKMKSTKINLLKGLLSSVIDPKKKTKFLVKTKSGTLGVRGTKFLVQESDLETYLCVCEGEVEASNKFAKVSVNPGEDVHLSLESKDLKVSQASSAMWKMSLEQFSLMGVKVAPRN